MKILCYSLNPINIDVTLIGSLVAAIKFSVLLLFKLIVSFFHMLNIWFSQTPWSIIFVLDGQDGQVICFTCLILIFFHMSLEHEFTNDKDDGETILQNQKQSKTIAISN
jgi:hypothetical protein